MILAEPSSVRNGWRRMRFDVPLIGFVLLFAVINAALFQWPVFNYALTNLDATTGLGALTLVVLVVLQIGLMLLLLLLASLLSVRLVKVVCVLLLIGNAIALYFMVSFGAVLDRQMMGNVFNTRSSEAFELLHPNLLLYLLLAALPVAMVMLARIRAPGRGKRLLWLLGISTVLGGVVYGSGPSWLWFDKHAKHLGGIMLPWAYIGNSLRYYDQALDAKRPQQRLPDLHFSAVPATGKTVVVLVIGEAARRENFSLYGYPRPTNPQLMAVPALTAMPNAKACASYTTAALRCMLSHLGSQSGMRVNHEPLPSYLHRFGVDVIWRSNNWGEPPIKVDTYETAKSLAEACVRDCGEAGYDGMMLHGLSERILGSSSQRVFVVLHQTGSHGPAYASKYPRRFETFKPVCRSVELQQCDRGSLMNAYDNTIVYTDDVLARVIAMLDGLPNVSSTMLYMSDHGESLGENGFYLHGAPASIAPEVQLDIPFLIWMSPSFRQQHGLAGSRLAHRPDYTQDAIFHSVLGAFGGRSPVYRQELDVFASAASGQSK